MTKKCYEKPAVHTEDVSTAFAGACCTKESPIGWNPNMLSPACRLPGCHFELNSYNASG